MEYHRDQSGNEVDENGYLRTAVEGWAEHGISPPPLCGDWRDPAAVEAIRAQRARWDAMSNAERILAYDRVQAFADRWDREHGVDTRPGVFKTS